jgi:DNA polymerase III subunit beta
MKITLFRDNFASAMRLVKEAVPSRSTLPILANVRITTTDSSIRMTGTNLELTIVASLGAAIAQPGDVTLPAETLSNLLEKFSDEQVSLELVDAKTHTIRLTSGKNIFNVKGLPPQDFPSIPPIVSEGGLSLNAAHFRESVTAILDCAADEEAARPIFAGVLFSFKPDSLVLAAADGFRLGSSGFPMTVPEAWQGKQVIVAAKSLRKVVKTIGESETLTLTLPEADDRRIQFALPNLEITVQLIEGTYPDYKGIVPKAHTTRAVFDTAHLLHAAKTAALLTQQGNFTFTPGAPGALTLKCLNQEKGDGKVDLEGPIEGAGVTVAMQLKYLEDALSALKSLGAPRAALEMNTATHPIMVNPVDLAANRPQVAYVIMPLMSKN